MVTIIPRELNYPVGNLDAFDAARFNRHFKELLEVQVGSKRRASLDGYASLAKHFRGKIHLKNTGKKDTGKYMRLNTSPPAALRISVTRIFQWGLTAASFPQVRLRTAGAA
jgi:hypothetical protein